MKQISEQTMHLLGYMRETYNRTSRDMVRGMVGYFSEQALLRSDVIKPAIWTMPATDLPGAPPPGTEFEIYQLTGLGEKVGDVAMKMRQDNPYNCQSYCKQALALINADRRTNGGAS